MSWVDRLQEATGWHQERLEPDWAELESDLGTTLPEDYKELCARFEPGSFSGFVSLLRGGDDRLHDLRSVELGTASRISPSSTPPTAGRAHSGRFPTAHRRGLRACRARS